VPEPACQVIFQASLQRKNLFCPPPWRPRWRCQQLAKVNQAYRLLLGGRSSYLIMILAEISLPPLDRGQ
jgi:hypothetical protein